MPARFKFRLEALLRVRKSLEEEAKRHLARMLANLEQTKARVAELEAAQLAAMLSRQVAPGSVVNLEEWRNTERFLFVVEQRIKLAKGAVLLAEGQVAASRKALLKAHQNHLIIQRLKERRQEQHAQELLREETREMDEIAVLRYHISHPTASNL